MSADFDSEKLKQAEKEVESVIAAGAPVVQLSIFDSLKDYVPSAAVCEQVKYTTELYADLVNKLGSCSDKEKSAFLIALKDAETINNHSMEKEDPFLIMLSKRLVPISAIDLLLAEIDSGKKMSLEDFIDIHDILLQGTSSSEQLGLRENDLKVVASLDVRPDTKYFFGGMAISYFPLRHTEIKEAVDRLLDFINSSPRNEYDSFLLPMACHGLIASLQLFKDGNTRYGRLVQSTMMHRFLNKDFNVDFQLPLVYGARQYAAYRSKYRELVEGIAVESDNASWDRWFDFNLRRIQDGILYNINCLDEMKRREKIHR